MGDMDLLECMIETEINKLKYQQRIAKEKGKNKTYLALINKMTGLKEALGFIEEIERMEE